MDNRTQTDNPNPPFAFDLQSYVTLRCHMWILPWNQRQQRNSLASVRLPKKFGGKKHAVAPGRYPKELRNSMRPAFGNSPLRIPHQHQLSLWHSLTTTRLLPPEIDCHKSQSDSLASRLGSYHLNPTKAWVLYSSVSIPKVYFPHKISSYRTSLPHTGLPPTPSPH